MKCLSLVVVFARKSKSKQQLITNTARISTKLHLYFITVYVWVEPRIRIDCAKSRGISSYIFCFKKEVGDGRFKYIVLIYTIIIILQCPYLVGNCYCYLKAIIIITIITKTRCYVSAPSSRGSITTPEV